MLDGIIITGKTEEEHIENLRYVLTRLKERGLKMNPAKCEYMQKAETFLGHIIYAAGIHMIEDKVQAVNDASVLTIIDELRVFLGLINCYHGFVPNLAAILRPLTNFFRRHRSGIGMEYMRKLYAELKKSWCLCMC